MNRRNPEKVSGFCDPNEITFCDRCKKLDHFRIQHFHAAAAKWLADSILVIGAVDVNVALVRILPRTGIPSGFQALKAQDAARNQVRLLFRVAKL